MTGAGIKRGLLLFWAAWLAVIAASNLFGFLKALGLLEPGWRFASQNFRLVREITASYETTAGLAGLLFIGIIAWQAYSVCGFLQAYLTYRGPVNWPAIYRAFGVSLALWAAFLVAGELFVHYEYEGIHMRILTAQLASLLAIRLLPD